MKSKMSAKSSNAFLFVAIGFLMLVSSFSAQAQRKCKMVQRVVVVQEYNWRTDRLESVERLDWVEDCSIPIVDETPTELLINTPPTQNKPNTTSDKVLIYRDGIEQFTKQIAIFPNEYINYFLRG